MGKRLTAQARHACHDKSLPSSLPRAPPSMGHSAHPYGGDLRAPHHTGSHWMEETPHRSLLFLKVLCTFISTTAQKCLRRFMRVVEGDERPSASFATKSLRKSVSPVSHFEGMRPLPHSHPRPSQTASALQKVGNLFPMLTPKTFFCHGLTAQS